MLQHCRKVLDKWNVETRENKLRTARELLVCSHSARTREDLVFKSCKKKKKKNCFLSALFSFSFFFFSKYSSISQVLIFPLKGLLPIYKLSEILINMVTSMIQSLPLQSHARVSISLHLVTLVCIYSLVHADVAIDICIFVICYVFLCQIIF